MNNSSSKGHYAELKVATEATKKGYLVGMMPQQSPYDMVIDRGDGPLRVQVKYRSKNSRGACEIILNPKNKRNNNVIYDKTNIDVIVIFEPESEEIAWIPIELIDHKNMITIRKEKPKNNQTDSVMLFENYTNW